MQAQVFISHSAKEQGASEALTSLSTSLEAKGFRVLLDRERLKPNVEWRREIHTWMALCHAAVVLFSPSALQSSWVLKEASILSWRRSLDERFVLIPMLVPPVTRAQLDADPFGPLAINEIEFAGGTRPVQEALDRLDVLQVSDLETPMESWVRVLTRTLLGVERDSPQTLDEAAAEVGEDLPWVPGLSKSALLARRLLHSDRDAIERAVQKLAGVLRPTELADVVDVLACVWVDPLAAARIPEVSTLPEGGRAIALNATDPWTGEMYVRKAACGARTWKVLEANNASGEDEVERISNELFEDARQKFGLRRGQTLDGFLDWVERYGKSRGKYFALIPYASSLDESVITAIQERFSAFTLVLLTGDEEPSRAVRASRAVVLAPPLLAGEEQQAQDWFDYLWSFTGTGPRE
jgi:hypothetical protein